MAKGKPPDPRKKKIQQTHATYLPVASGAKEPGYKAGELFGCYGHRTSANQPCVFDITDGALQCPFCAANMDPVWRGYVPVWDRDWALRYVLVNEEYFVSVDAIPVGAQVLILRGKNKISPLVIRQEVCLTRPLPDQAPFNKPVNMFAVCQLLWKNAALNKWAAEQDARGLVADVAKVVEAPKPVAEKFAKSPIERLKEAEEKHLREQAEQEEHAGEIMNRLLKPARNGKNPFHKPT
jgi:hypothetical protein